MRCKFSRVLYPKSTTEDGSGFMIVLYRPIDRVLDAQGTPVDSIKAVGYYLPTAEQIEYELLGHWAKSRYGVQFEVESFEELVPPTRDGIVHYLSSGLIKGIGKRIAERIYDAFGEHTLDILDHHPERLIEISGISKQKLEKITEALLTTRGIRNLMTLLAPHGVTVNCAARIFNEYGGDSIRIVKEHPFQLCEVHGFGFKTADKIAQSLGLDPLATERVDAGILYTLKEEEGGGHLCLNKAKLLKKCAKLLNTDGLTEEMLAVRAYALLLESQIALYGDDVYRGKTAKVESDVAMRVFELLHASTKLDRTKIAEELSQAEKRIGLSLASEQKEAVITSLSAGLSIVSGGPGTGKTSIQKFILDIYQTLFPEGKIICCAPTGRAARRMQESTGHSSTTIHKALGLLAGDDGSYNEPEMLDADLVLVDEVSMVDIYLARNLLLAIPDGTKLVLIGDSDQLPSVGPGAVLSELVRCGHIPVVQLDKVYRQAVGSRIPVNAAIIRHNGTHLEYGDDFRLIETNSFALAAEVIERVYAEEVGRYGPENVLVLSPFRAKTETGVNELNLRLQKLANPVRAGQQELQSGRISFRTHDRVMQMQNKGDINNGDVGRIRSISIDQDESVAELDFGDGRMVEYEVSQLKMLDLAYASTVHKSQGSEYDSIILTLQTGHYPMLKRPLIYTAITRAKKRVTLVGERRALCMAIKTVDAEKRNTNLAHRIQMIHSTTD